MDILTNEEAVLSPSVVLSTQVFPSLVSFPSGQASQADLSLLGTFPLQVAHLPSDSYSLQSVILV